MRAVVPFIVTIVLACALAPITGTLLFGVITGTPWLLHSRDLAGIPVLVYAAKLLLPIVVPASFVVAGLAMVFVNTFGRSQPYWVWVIVFSALGLLLGSACAAPMIVACLQAQDFQLGLVWWIIGAICGVLFMGSMSVLWFFSVRIL